MDLSEADLSHSFLDPRRGGAGREGGDGGGSRHHGGVFAVSIGATRSGMPGPRCGLINNLVGARAETHQTSTRKRPGRDGVGPTGDTHTLTLPFLAGRGGDFLAILSRPGSPKYKAGGGRAFVFRLGLSAVRDAFYCKLRGRDTPAVCGAGRTRHSTSFLAALDTETFCRGAPFSLRTGPA